MHKGFITLIGGMVAVMLTGCSPKTTQLSDNTYLVKCEGIFNGMSDCVAEAKKRCPVGYEVLNAKDETTIGTSVNKEQIVPFIGGAKRSILIKCH